MKNKVMTFTGMWLLRFGRYFLSKSCERCWICGCNPGMCTINKRGHWCSECEKRWKQYDHDEFIVDWRGLGRIKK